MALFAPVSVDSTDHPLSYKKIGVLAEKKDPTEDSHLSIVYEIKDPTTETIIKSYQAYLGLTKETECFVYLSKITDNEYQSSILKGRSNGYKIHISIYDPDDADTNLEKAWNILVKLFIEYDISDVKIIAPCFRADLRANPFKCCKPITIYTFKEDRPSEKWQEFLIKASEELIAADIIPGYLPSSDEEIKGSSYFSYRNDGSPYITNPFSSLDLSSVKGQQERGGTKIIEETGSTQIIPSSSLSQ